MNPAMNRINNIVGQLTASPVSNSNSHFSTVVQAKPDAILGVKVAFLADKSPLKMNLGIGAYRTEEGKPLVLSCVRKAEQIVVNDLSLDKEYLTQTGDAEFNGLARDLFFGANSSTKGRVVTTQALSGTGSLRVASEFVKRFLPGRKVLTSTPTWGNHNKILKDAGVPQGQYRYWEPKARNLDIKGMLADIQNAPNGSIIMLHACAHNPTGVDPTESQWREILKVIQAKGHLTWFDSAYQGFASGDLEKDAFGVRLFAEAGQEMIACQSFAKNFGLYGERIGALHVVTKDANQVKPITSQLALIIRALYSNPPKHGARIVKTVLKTPALMQEWREELLAMSLRIQDMRAALVAELKRLNTPGDWSHITSQIGMFSFTGLSPKQCEVMMSKWHVYLLSTGRISMAGINTRNVAHLAQGIDDVVRNVQ